MPNKTKVKPKVKQEFIGSIKDAESHQTGNRHILRGYRINFKSAKSLIKSIFMVHNESINIWSHLLGALLFVLLL